MTSIEFCSQLLSLENSLLRFAYKLNLKKDDAKDLVQETFLRVLMKKDKYIDNARFKSWTFTIMKNAFVDNYRRTLSQNTFSDQTLDSFFINKAEPAGCEDPDSTYSAIEITRNIGLLNEKYRVPFQMYINGYKYNEIADELNLKIGTVKSRIFLSRKQLMNQLKS